MGRQSGGERYSDQETEQRYKGALKRMLSTPHQPHKPIGKRKRSPKRAKPVEKPGR